MRDPERVRKACSAYFASAKRWLALGLALKIGIYVLGLLSVFTGLQTGVAAVLILTCTMAGEGCLLRSDHQKGVGESLLRHLDLNDAFGNEIPAGYLSDVFVRQPRERPYSFQSPYFASTLPPGPRRAFENVRESVWWSKHVAAYAWQYLLWPTISLFVISLVGLMLVLNVVREPNTQVAIGRVVSATLLLAFSLGLSRFVIGYQRFSVISSKLEERAEVAMTTNSSDEALAQTLYREYHIARSGAPMLPTWLWRWKNRILNQQWQEMRRSS